ncbi:hypothetical protein [Stenotrophomonas sp. HMWF003]|jgi:hypothetical protein|uniref:hypothetical protein n=1 Tax=Stenotrophomonas sp. HMWF003 TaxID=2056840 RepID=UPI000D41080E|nr:hypothetical protein [Stenotrophomonas sp. HMWF003]PTT61350.1 hypothetical protein DBR34_10835 [Stenotrophomonas sp. HMWF003]
MSKRVFMQVTVDPGLCARFHETAAREHCPVETLLHQVMHAYISRSAAADGQAPRDDCGDPDPDAWARRQQGWHCSPFGMA